MEPIYVADLFPVLDTKLIELLRVLTPEQWNRRATPNWTVHQVAAHLLDGNLRRLSMARDKYFGESFSGSSEQDFVRFLLGLNADWVRAFRRISPPVLIELLAAANREVAQYFQSLDPHGPAAFPVSWAGESQSENWFDIAREYTEKWHHQQQIREAAGQDGIMARELYHPVLDTFMRSLPYCYRNVDATPASTLAVHVTGDAGGDWFLSRGPGNWQLSRHSVGEIRAEVTIPGEIAWKLFTKGLSEDAADEYLSHSGDSVLSRPITRVLAIVG
ncbi:MAG: maleylpyruvate isomerase family mycothiol-dependent enzyme [Terriglobia bacterium]|nr:maleylpyruvate isomerase family mycothiol-dependent enzyme [Terriglobia bacterium]